MRAQRRPPFPDGAGRYVAAAASNANAIGYGSRLSSVPWAPPAVSPAHPAPRIGQAGPPNDRETQRVPQAVTAYGRSPAATLHSHVTDVASLVGRYVTCSQAPLACV